MKIVREFSAAGPCITLGRLVSETPKFYRYAEWHGSDNFGPEMRLVAKRTPKRYSAAHIEPCPSCRDHPRTQYPDGYMD